MANDLTIKQRKFVSALAEHGNATQAAVDAGYDVQDRQSAKVIASQNLARPAIRTALDFELAQRGLDETAISQVLSEVIENGTASEKLRAVELLIKIRGDEKPKKSIRATLTYRDWAIAELKGKHENENQESKVKVHVQPTVSLITDG